MNVCVAQSDEERRRKNMINEGKQREKKSVCEREGGRERESVKVRVCVREIAREGGRGEIEERSKLRLMSILF